jgi:beta-glucanase (GH16 family)
MHGSFWIQGAGPGSAEIDVAEYFGAGRNDGGLSNFVHTTGADGQVTSVGGTQPTVPKLLDGKDPSDGWHVYSVEWSPKGYTFRLDGVPTFHTDQAGATAQEFMVLSLLTSDYELPRMTNPSSTMKVDWVRVWQ